MSGLLWNNQYKTKQVNSSSSITVSKEQKEDDVENDIEEVEIWKERC